MGFHPSTCPFCACGCGLLLEETQGRLAASYPSADPPARSSLCMRGWNCTSAWSHPDRLTVPMLRGGNRLQPASRQEAIEAIAGRLTTAGSPPLFALSPSLANEDAAAMCDLAEHVGGRACTTDLTGAAVARDALRRVADTRYGLSDPDAITTADLVWVVGSDPGECPQVASRVTEARRRGVPVVRFDVHASAEDGARAVALGPDDFGSLVERLDADAPEGISLRSAARPVVIIGSRWLCSSAAAPRTRDLLEALAKAGAAGRVLFAVGEVNSWGLLDVLEGRDAPVADLACREAPLDTLFIAGDDLVRRSPRPDALAAILSGCRTVVVIDRFATDCLPFAHVVLPSCGFAETDGTVTSVFGHARQWKQVVAPPGEAAPERVWAARIAEALQGFSGAGLPAGFSRVGVGAAGRDGAPGSSLIQATHDTPAQAVVGDADLPLRLVVGSVPANWSTGVVGQRDELLRREVVESVVMAAPSVLKDAGVKPGWPVALTVPDGRATVTARADPRLPPGVLVLVPLAGSGAASLRASRPMPGGRGVGFHPVPARIERT